MISFRHVSWAMIAVCLFMIAQTYAQTNTALNKDGYIQDWLIAGPYPNRMVANTAQGYDANLLEKFGGEQQLEPYAGMTDEAVFEADASKLAAQVGAVNEWGFTATKKIPVRWTAWHTNTPIINLDAKFGEIRDLLVVYAAAWIVSPEERTVQFRVGSDDGFKLYLNHRLVGGVNLNRATTPDTDILPATLRAGPNLILMKITDQAGGHSFCLRVTGANGLPFPDLQVSLINPTRKWVDLCANIGEVDVTDRRGFAKIRLGTGPILPGILPVTVMVGTEKRISCMATWLVTDSQSRELLRQESVIQCSPERAKTLQAEVAVTAPGPVTVALMLKDPISSEVLAHLARTFDVIDPVTLRAERDTLKRTLQERTERRVEQQAIANKLKDQMKALRQETDRQYADIERRLAERRDAVVAKIGKEGCSIDQPFTAEVKARETLCLNGDGWEYVTVERGTPRALCERMPTSGWTQGTVPRVHSKYPGDGCVAEWYRLRVAVPAQWSGRRLAFSYDQAEHGVHVYWDGVKVGERWGWPRGDDGVVELSQATPGEHELAVLVLWSDYLAQPSAIHGYYWGLMGDVTLSTLPEISVEDTWVKTSWRRAAIEAEVWVTNRGAQTQSVTVSAQAVKDGRVRLDLGTQAVRLDPRQGQKVVFDKPWVDPALWGIGGEYGAPNLQHLVVTIRSDVGRVLDQQATRFGFREFWIEGLHFYLNGKRLFVQGDVLGNRFVVTSRPEQIFWQQTLRETANLNLIRVHFENQQSQIADVADQLGMLFMPQLYPLYLEVSGTNGPFKAPTTPEQFVQTPEFKQGCAAYDRWMRWLRNHPSVMFWGTDNEVMTQCAETWYKGVALDGQVRNDKVAAAYGRYVKAHDPTRFVIRCGDEGTWGTAGKFGLWNEDPPADVADYHYPDYEPDKYRHWQSTYKKPFVPSETLYTAYSAFDNYIGAIPSQVAAKAGRVRNVVGEYTSVEMSWVGMGLGLDGFIEKKTDGSGTPWGKPFDKLPGALAISWPALSGPSYKNSHHALNHYYGYTHVNWFDTNYLAYVLNAVNRAYKESSHPMPPLSKERPVEALIRVQSGGKPIPYAQVFLSPKSGQTCGMIGVLADSNGRAWFALDEPGRYEARVEGRRMATPITVKRVPFTFKPGFDYLTRITLEIADERTTP